MDDDIKGWDLARSIESWVKSQSGCEETQSALRRRRLITPGGLYNPNDTSHLPDGCYWTGQPTFYDREREPPLTYSEFINLQRWSSDLPVRKRAKRGVFLRRWDDLPVEVSLDRIRELGL